MEPTRFAARVASVREGLTRRALGRLAGAGVLLAATLPAMGDRPGAAAKKKRARAEHNIRGKKAIMCVDGVTRRVAKSKRKKYLNQGATRGECHANPACIPTCPAGICGDDGCGGTCACASGSICVEGTCTACTLTCSGAPAACGGELQAAIAEGGDIYLCPGIYRGGFQVTGTVTIIGAGNGNDPAVDSILDGNDDASILTVLGLGTASVRQARFTNGLAFFGGGGATVFSTGTFTADDCAFIDNSATSGGGAVYTYGGTVALRNSTFTGNTSPNGAGALSISASPSTVVVENCVFTDNQGDTGGGATFDTSTVTVISSTFDGNSATAQGGAVEVASSTVTFSGGCQIRNNTATNGGGISGNVPPSIITLNDTVFANNTPQNCYGFIC